MTSRNLIPALNLTATQAARTLNLSANFASQAATGLSALSTSKLSVVKSLLGKLAVELVRQGFWPHTLELRALLRKQLRVAPTQQPIDELPVEPTPAQRCAALLSVHGQEHVQEQRIEAQLSDRLAHLLVERLCRGPTERIGEKLVGQVGGKRLHLPTPTFEVDQFEEHTQRS